ncbi:amidophosphoribosyltransferase [Eubacteriales bacterium OttesenSCG-928-N14]|nr:amidophosphoribosyltransferase [Eubacteriales bacterium OttesenSCG-928-N14]
MQQILHRHNHHLDKPKEECGVFGAFTQDKHAAGITYNALIALQHRGQESAGIAALDGNAIGVHKDTGLVSEVFPSAQCLPTGHAAIGHVRYSTTGGNVAANAQPFVVEYLKGRLAAAHNGNVVNTAQIKKRLQEYGSSFLASSDSEIIATLIAYEALKAQRIEDAVAAAAAQLIGAFSMVILSSQNKLIALRDGSGFRPLCIGKGPNGYAVASESCAFDSTGYAFLRDIAPGEMVVIDATGIIETRQVLPGRQMGMCIFEYVYFARPDSILDGLSVYEARHNMGRILAQETPVEADMVCGVPDSGMEAAAGFAAGSGIPLLQGFVKNRYIGRSFIFPTQSQRQSAIRLKLNPLAVTVKGKRVVLVDDSIVRGNTSRLIIQAMRDAGAAQVHMRVSSPPFLHVCHFGTDIDDEHTLVANRLDIGQIADEIGADSLGYLSVGGLQQACSGAKLPFCTGCFNGNYPVEVGSHHKALFEEGKA